MNIPELSRAIGQTGLLSDLRTDIKFSIRILDARISYSRVDLLVTPVTGTGQTWVSAERVQIDKGSI